MDCSTDPVVIAGYARTPLGKFQGNLKNLGASDDLLHGGQEGRFYHGYYRGYCYLPLYIFCGEHLLGARLREANQDAAADMVDKLSRIVEQIWRHWSQVWIILRGDSGFCRDEIMSWCEADGGSTMFWDWPRTRV